MDKWTKKYANYDPDSITVPRSMFEEFYQTADRIKQNIHNARKVNIENEDLATAYNEMQKLSDALFQVRTRM